MHPPPIPSKLFPGRSWEYLDDKNEENTPEYRLRIGPIVMEVYPSPDRPVSSGMVRIEPEKVLDFSWSAAAIWMSAHWAPVADQMLAAELAALAWLDDLSGAVQRAQVPKRAAVPLSGLAADLGEMAVVMLEMEPEDGRLTMAPPISLPVEDTEEVPGEVANG